MSNPVLFIRDSPQGAESLCYVFEHETALYFNVAQIVKLS